MNNLLQMKNLSAATLLVILVGLVGFVQAQQTEQSFTVAKRYNLIGQVTGVISPRPVTGAAFPAVRNTYNTQGLLQTVESGSLSSFPGESIAPSSWSGFTIFKRITYIYDDLGRKLSERELVLAAAASTTEASNAPAHTVIKEYSYDDYGRTNCVAKRLSTAVLGNACSMGSDIGYGPDRITRYEYTPDNFGLVYKEFRAVGTIHEQTYVTNTYDTYGRLTDQVDANNNRTHLDYNAQNRLETMYFPDKVSKNTYSLTDKEVYGYDNNGNRTSLLKRDGVNTIIYKYDALNREIEKIIPTPANGSKNVYTTYDLLNLKTSVRFASISGSGVTYKYDGFGELTEEQSNVTGTTYTVKNAYDKHGNRIGVTYNDNRVFTYTYDSLDRSRDILEGGSGSPVLIRNNFDSFARISTQNTIGNVSTRIDYDKLSRPYSIALSINMAALNQSFKFKYNPVGQVVDETMTNDLYLYEEAGSKTGSYTVNNLNQYTGVGSQSYGYDKNGNLICDGGYVQASGSCSGKRYTYDVENRLIQVATPSIPYSPYTTLDYDPMGRLSKVSVSTPSSVTSTNFQYNGDQMIAEYKNGAMQNRYVFGEGVDKPIVSYTGSGVSAAARVFLHSNHQGSIALATDTNGNGKYINTYDAYGVPGKANQGRFGYTGQMWVPEIGMHYYKARIYYPQIGRFLQTDPIGYKDDMDLYTYVGNDPVNQTDPTGLCPMCLGALAGAGINIAIQIGSGMASGKDFSAAVKDINVGQVVGAAAAGAVGALGVQMVKGALSGTASFAGQAVKIEGAAARVAVGVDGAAKAAAGGATTGAINNQDPKGIGTAAIAKIVDGFTGGAPVGTIANAVAGNSDKIEQGVQAVSDTLESSREAGGVTETNNSLARQACASAGMPIGCQ